MIQGLQPIATNVFARRLVVNPKCHRRGSGIIGIDSGGQGDIDTIGSRSSYVRSNVRPPLRFRCPLASDTCFRMIGSQPRSVTGKAHAIRTDVVFSIDANINTHVHFWDMSF